MSVHAVNHQSLVASSHSPAQAPAKPASNGAFAQLFGNYIPSKAASTDTSQATTPPSATGFAALFSNYNPPVPKTPAGATATGSTTPPAPFTATYEQGAIVSGADGSQTAMNPLELATSSTADEVAKLLGGTVVSSNLGGSYTSSVPTREISVPGSNVQINAGLAANLFATYGTGAGSQAWQIINRDLGLNLGPSGSTGPVS